MNTKRLLRLPGAALLLGLTLSACGNKENDKAAQGPAKADKSFYTRMYERAVKQSDPYTQIVAINGMLTEDSAANRNYKDSLASLYAVVGLEKSSRDLIDQALRDKPENEDLNDLKIRLSKTPEEAIQLSRQLLGQTNKIKYLFIIANLQLQAGHTKDAEATMQKIEAHPAYATDSVPAPLPDGTENYLKAEAGLWLLKAQAAAVRNDIAGARKYIDMILKKYPNEPHAMMLSDQINQAMRQPRR